jgi:hypothetical protein
VSISAFTKEEKKEVEGTFDRLNQPELINLCRVAENILRKTKTNAPLKKQTN